MLRRIRQLPKIGTGIHPSDRFTGSIDLDLNLNINANPDIIKPDGSFRQITEETERIGYIINLEINLVQTSTSFY
uniref:Uncharacterized protein n=1 Tax=Rhizophagus irregularis (strain DAOM 181602 / DAOM 197198 / MUCL 43194) TaxID=747089 RepID=U9SY73_RHIID